MKLLKIIGLFAVVWLLVTTASAYCRFDNFTTDSLNDYTSASETDGFASWGWDVVNVSPGVVQVSSWQCVNGSGVSASVHNPDSGYSQVLFTAFLAGTLVALAASKYYGLL